MSTEKERSGLRALRQARSKEILSRVGASVRGFNPFLMGVSNQRGGVSQQQRMAMRRPIAQALGRQEQYFHGQETGSRAGAAGMKQQRLLSVMAAEINKAATQGDLSAKNAQIHVAALTADLQDKQQQRTRADSLAMRYGSLGALGTAGPGTRGTRGARGTPSIEQKAGNIYVAKARALATADVNGAMALVDNPQADPAERDLAQRKLTSLGLGDPRVRRTLTFNPDALERAIDQAYGIQLADMQSGGVSWGPGGSIEDFAKWGPGGSIEDFAKSAATMVSDHGMQADAGMDANTIAVNQDALAYVGDALKQMALKGGYDLSPGSPDRAAMEASVGPQVMAAVDDAVNQSTEWSSGNRSKADDSIRELRKLGAGTSWGAAVDAVASVMDYDPQGEFSQDDLGRAVGFDGQLMQMDTLDPGTHQRLSDEGYQDFYGVAVQPRGVAGRLLMQQLDIIDNMPEHGPIKQAKQDLMQGAGYRKFVNQTGYDASAPATFKRYRAQVRKTMGMRKQQDDRRHAELQRTGVAPRGADLSDLPEDRGQDRLGSLDRPYQGG